MKVLGIVGSPRKGGNTEIMVEEALSAARELGAETDIFLVYDKNIAGCDGCHSCVKTRTCKIEDDMQLLYPKIFKADAIIFGSPVYFNGITAQLKAVIDRTFAFRQYRALEGKVATPVLAVRRIGGGQARFYLQGFFVAQGMIPTRGAIGYGREKGDVRTGVGSGIDKTAMEEARDAGKEVVELVFHNYKYAGNKVSYQVLGTKPNGHTNHTETGEHGPDRYTKFRKHHEDNNQDNDDSYQT